MSTNLKAKLNQLLQSTPPHTVILSSWLVKRGYSLDLQKKYKKNNWLESVGYGAMKRSGDDIDYLSGIYAIQSQANLKIHIGAQSALSLLGKSQYLELSDKPTIKLFSIKNNDLPLWFKNYHWNINISFNIASFLPSDLGLSDYSVHNNFKVKISTPARAIMECIHLASNNQDYIECYESMEGLNNLNPRTVQLLLENCSSIKIKRMFLEKGITFCELKLEGCMNWPLQIAHRHKRVYYKDKPELLYDFGEVALACQLCHSKIEGDRELTEEVFNKIR